MRTPRQRGFTLIEIMVVLVIIGILAALIVPNIMGRPDQARITSARHDLSVITQALKLYKLDNGQYPTRDQGLDALVRKPSAVPLPKNWHKPYLEQLPKDPWGNAYVYTVPGLNGDVDLLSYGADGQPGGEGNDADIGNWMR